VFSQRLGATHGEKPRTRKVRRIANWLMHCALLAGGYFLAGRLGQLLAMPPDYATTVWPASGIALAGMLLAGYRVWPGLFLGALLINGWTPLSNADSLAVMMSSSLVPVSISVGATAQAALGVFLIRRFVGYPSALIQDHHALGFLTLGGPIACLVGASVGVASLRFGNVIDGSQIAWNWWTWWFGDTIGVIIFAPLTMICFARPRHAWRPRWLSVALPMAAAFIVTVVGFVWAQTSEQFSTESRFDGVAGNATQQLEEQLLGHLDALHAVEGFYASSRIIRRAEFASFNHHSLTRHSGIHAVAWLPRIRQAERQAHEDQTRDRGLSEYRLTERAADQSYVESQEREEYFPVFFLEPRTTTDIRLGFDVASNPALQEVMSQCRDSGRHLATGPIRLDPTSTNKSRILVFAPIYSKDGSPETVAERQQFLRGFVVGLFNIGDIVRAALPMPDSRDFSLTIIDPTTDIGDRVVYAQPPSVSPHKPSEVAPILNQTLGASKSIYLADRRWICVFTPTTDFFSTQANRNTWLILVSGLSLTALLGTFLLILSGRTARIKASESRYLDLYENAPDMFISVGVSTQRVIECNATFLDVTGFSKSEIVDRHIYDLFDLDSRTEVRRARQLFLDSGQALDLELRLVCSDGRLLDTSMNVRAVCDEQGESIYCRAVLRDITARKRVEAQMKQQEMELAHVARLSMMGEMATGLAHEINQPLAAIAAYAEGAAIRIRDGNSDIRSIARVVDRISADAHRAGEVISRLRQFVKNREPDRCDIDINELVREVAKFAAPDVKLREVGLGLDLQEPLPNVRGDAIQIQQVLLNLVRNGCDAMADVDSIQRRVTIRTRYDGEGEIQVSVDDCGHGLSENTHEQVFEAFFSTKEDGLGLGLAISRSIVESHGGRIWAMPNVDGGASFQFSLSATNRTREK
jgi:PAS domain S-box-containing protein